MVIAPAIKAITTMTCTMNPTPPKNIAARGEQAAKRRPNTSRIIPKKIFRKVPIVHKPSIRIVRTSIPFILVSDSALYRH